MTDSRILMRKPGSAWHSPVITTYANEDALQKLLEESPQLLPWSDASAVAVARELLIAVDESTDEIKGIVEFLNRHTDAELRIVALELNLVADDGVEVLLPSVFAEETVRAKRTTTGQPIDQSTFISLVEQYAGPDGAAGFERVFEHAQSKGVRFSWGEGESTPSMSAWYYVEGQEMRVWSSYLYKAAQRATFDINFEYLAQRGAPAAMADGYLAVYPG
jgi:hypothetical protein